jgi:mono/diheme cytochrome c family protein
VGSVCPGNIRRDIPGSAAEPVGPLPPAAQTEVAYERDVAPVFQRHCIDCHGPDTQESRLRVDLAGSLLAGGDSGEPAVIRGQSESSYLIQVVSGQHADLRMPPDADPLSSEEIGILRAWIDQGMPGIPSGHDPHGVPGTDHWSFQPLQRPRVPLDSENHPVDAFIRASLQSLGLDLSPPADRRTQIRRLYLDVLGLLPSPREVEDFLADDSPDAYQRLVDRVLASPRYGERWGQHWLDVVRFAETNGFETNTPRPRAYPYRDYVIQALNHDRPYDQFVLEQLAGDGLGADAATGFLVAGAYDEVKSPDIGLTLMQRQDELADIINVTGGTILGLTLGCARCHNHKFDPVLQRDYYALQAVFAGVRHGERELRSEDAGRRRAQAAQLTTELEHLEEQLSRYAPVEDDTNRSSHPAWRIDDRDPSLTAGMDVLSSPSGTGENPPGTERGHRDDPGDIQRLPNLSGGSYTWWQAAPGENVSAYRPRQAGLHAIWVSWGCGWESHAADARYLLDRDGDPHTTDDQVLLAQVDQRVFADGSAAPAGKSLWSGLLYVGTHELTWNAAILVQNGEHEAAVTADTVVIEPRASTGPREGDGAAPPPRLPRLRPAVRPEHNVEHFPPIPARWVRMRIEQAGGSEPCLDELEIFATSHPNDNVALAARGAVPASSGDYAGNPKHRLEHLIDGRYGNSFSWISAERDRGWVEVELPTEVAIERIEWGRDRLGEFRDRVPSRYEFQVATEPNKWQVIASSQQRLPAGQSDPNPWAYRYAEVAEPQRAELERLLAKWQKLRRALSELQQVGPTAYVGRLEHPEPTRRLYRGDPLQPREEVAPDTLGVLGTLELSGDAPEDERRLAFARWVADPENPLTPRVMANRVWQHHFGRGLVATPSDFGGHGARPSHPELLDWLACQLLDHGWSLKTLHRLILTSETYRQASAPRAEGLAVDAESRWLWRFPPRRLEAESLRDNLLLVAGVLDQRMFGPGYSAFEPNTNYVRVYTPRDTMGPDTWRRMIYMTKVRMEQDSVFGAFDCPDAGQPAPTRGRSTTAVQALNLLNSPFSWEMAERVARRVAEECGPGHGAEIEYLFQLAYGRPPDADEWHAAQQLREQHGLVSVCRAILNSNEFLTIP